MNMHMFKLVKLVDCQLYIPTHMRCNPITFHALEAPREGGSMIKMCFDRSMAV